MALDKTNNNLAYLAGRAFALLQEAETRVKGSDIDLLTCRLAEEILTNPKKYFAHLMGKYYRGLDSSLDQEMTEIMDKVPSTGLPEHLSLEDQSVFAVAYQHERSYLKGLAR